MALVRLTPRSLPTIRQSYHSESILATYRIQRVWKKKGMKVQGFIGGHLLCVAAIEVAFVSVGELPNRTPTTGVILLPVMKRAL